MSVAASASDVKANDPILMSASGLDVAKNNTEAQLKLPPLTAAELTKLRTFTFYASDFTNEKITFKDPVGALKDGAVLQWGSPKIPGYFDSFKQLVEQDCNLKLIEAKARPCYLEFWNPEWLKRSNVAVILYAWPSEGDIFVDCLYYAKDNEFVTKLAKGLDHKLDLDQFIFLEGQLLGYLRPFRVDDVTEINDYAIRWIVTENKEEVIINVEVVRVGEQPVPTAELDAQLKRWNAALYPRICRYDIVPSQTKAKKRKLEPAKSEGQDKKSKEKPKRPKRLALGQFLSTEILGSLVEEWEIPRSALMKQAKELRNQLDEVKEEGELSRVLHGLLPFC